MKYGLLMMSLVSLISCTQAKEIHSPKGLWTSIDDKTGARKSVIEIVEKDGSLEGYIRVLLQEPSGEICTTCEGEWRNRSIKDLKILWGFEPANKEKDIWVDGRILDPKTNKTYRSRLTTTEIAKKIVLEVRGYILISLLGRTQTWVKPTPEDLKKLEAVNNKTAPVL